jgi:hypothetical protein
MTISVACPSCGIKLNVPEDFLGKKVRCASCKTVFEARSEGEVPPPRSGAAQERRTAKPKVPPPPDMDLPEAPLEEPVSQSKKRRVDEDLDSAEDQDRRDYDDEEDDRGRRRSRRRIRRDMKPHRGPMILVMGIASIVMGTLAGLGACCLPLAAFALIGAPLGATAWIMGHGDLKQMAQGEMDQEGRGTTNGGYICGIIGTILSTLSILCGIVALIFGIGMAMTNKM